MICILVHVQLGQPIFSLHSLAISVAVWQHTRLVLARVVPHTKHMWEAKGSVMKKEEQIRKRREYINEEQPRTPTGAT